MILVDTHCHLYLEEFKADLPDVMDRAKKEGGNQVLSSSN
jgi:Tat protein secretion system quality control protein TatD with DNase activity